MTKTKAQKLRVKLARKGLAKQDLRPVPQPAAKQKVKAKRKRSRRNRAGALSTFMPVDGVNGTRRIPNGVSMVSDGVNVGSVWKNTTSERVTFPLAREKFSDIASTAAVFELVEQLYVNPGNVALFPIFAEIAKNYEEYIPNVLRIYFRTEEFMASGSVVSAGMSAMAVDFDANDTNFSSMTQLENYSHAISGAPFSGIICLDVLEEINNRRRNGQRGNRGKDLSQNNYFVYYSNNSIGPTTDQAKFYDIGNFQFALANAQATPLVGELWIEYSFTMIRRKTPETAVAFSTQAIHLASIADDATATSRLGLTAFTNVVIRSGSLGGVANMATAGGLTAYGTGNYVGLNDAQDNIVNLPNLSAVWLVSLVWSGGTAIAAVPAIAGSGGLSIPSTWGPAGVSPPVGLFLAAGTHAAITLMCTTTRTVVPTSGSNAITLTGLTGMTDGNWDIYVSRLSDGMTTLDFDVARSPDLSALVRRGPEDRVTRLERMVKSLTLRHLDDASSIDDWKCYPPFSDNLKVAKNSSSSSSCEVKNATSLSDSVVDLIAAKLRK